MKRSDGAFSAVLVTGVTLWSIGALRRSLWGDEFHSLHHVRGESLAELFAIVRTDNHPPLSFLLERLSVALLGESELALRLPSLASGVLFLFLLRRLGRWSGAGETAPTLWLGVLSSFSFVIFTEARMYGLLAVSTLGLLVAVGSWLVEPHVRGRPPRARWWVAVWIAAGLHSHYYFFHYLAGTLVAVLFVAWRQERWRLAGQLLPPALVGVLAFVPWGAYGFVDQLGHELPAGGHLAGWRALAESFAHLFFMNASLGGELATYAVALPGTALVAFLGVLGCVEMVRSARDSDGQRVLLVLVGVVGVGVPLWAFGVSAFVERATYGWRYIAGSAAPLFLLVAVGTRAAGPLARPCRAGPPSLPWRASPRSTCSRPASRTTGESWRTSSSTPDRGTRS